MKKAIVLSAALLLAGAAAFAADVKFSGRARAGYVFNFEDGDYNSNPWKAKEEKLSFHVSDADGLWDINIKDLNGSLDSNDKLGAKLTVDLGKALEKNGIDLNGFGLSFNLGNMADNALLKAYDNVSADDRDASKLFGSYLLAFNASYDKFTAQLTLDPIHAEKGSGTAKGSDQLGRYYLTPAGEIVFVSSDDADTVDSTWQVLSDNDVTKPGSAAVKGSAENKMGIAVSGKYADKDLGFAVAAGYARNSAGLTGDGDDANKDKLAFGGVSYENGFVVSGNVDIAKIAKINDFKLKTGAFFTYMFDDDNKGLRVAADVSGGVDLVNGFIEYQFSQNDPDKKGADTLSYHYLKAQANLNFFSEYGVGLDVYFADTDLEHFGDYWLAGADVEYGLGGVTYGLNTEFGTSIAKDHDNVAFTITPKVIIAW